MQANLLIIDHQNSVPSRKPDHVKGLIEENRGQVREETAFSSTLAEVANEQPNHPEPAGEPGIARKGSGSGEAESEDLKKDADGEAESEDLKKDAKGDLTRAGKTSDIPQASGVRSVSNEGVVKGEVPGSGLKGSPIRLNVINKSAAGLDPVDRKLSMDPAGAGVKRKPGASAVGKGTEKPRVLEKTDGLLREMVAKSDKVPVDTEGTIKPRVLEKTDGLLREMVAKSDKVPADREGTIKPRVLEKTDGLLREMVAKSDKVPADREGTIKPRVLEKTDGLLREMVAKSDKVPADREGTIKPRVLEKTDGLLREMVAKSDKVPADTEGTIKPRVLEKTEMGFCVKWWRNPTRFRRIRKKLKNPWVWKRRSPF